MKTKNAMLILLFLLSCAVSAETWQPPEVPLPDLSKQTSINEISAVSQKLGSFKPAAFVRRTSLNGTWKMSPLLTSEKRFGKASAEELKFADAAFDDSKWNDAKVPWNWFHYKGCSPKKLFREGKLLDPDNAGGNDARGVINPYTKAWYRRTFELKDIPAQERILLDFIRINNEAELYVNGKSAAYHQGGFIPFVCDITPFLKVGKNTLALRVMSEYRPHDNHFVRTLGTLWGYGSYRAGIVGDVSLVTVPAPRIQTVKMVTPASGKLELHATVINTGSKNLSVTPGVSVVRALKGAVPAGKEFAPVTLKPGINKLKFTYDVKSPALWSPAKPELYFATLFFRNDKKILSADTQRIGFRDFVIKGTKFYLNGKETYLFFESAHSNRYCGAATPSGNTVDMRTVIAEYKKRGYNMLRTAHHPVPQEFLDIADELGMMIYDEWGMCFIDKVHEKLFEENNRIELTKFIEADHNHASVVMWSLGNEVKHKNSMAVVRQLDKQVDLVRKEDLQKRPVCTFAGVAGVYAYGYNKLKTDLLDLHTYVGITEPWTLTKFRLDQIIQMGEEVYTKGKKLNMPYIISESVGGGWGMRPDKNYGKGDVKKYLENYRKTLTSYTWGNPGGVGYSGSIGMAAALDKERNVRYLQNRLGRRILEQMRLHPKLAGISPWFADHKMASAPVWNQRYYPGLRLVGSYAPRQLYAGQQRTVQAFVINSGLETQNALRMEISLAANGKDMKLAAVKFPALPVGERSFVKTNITTPAGISGKAELKLTLFNGNKEIGRNSYDIMVHKPLNKLVNTYPVAVIGGGKEYDALFKTLGLNVVKVKDAKALKPYKRAVLCGPGKLDHTFAQDIRNWVENGGFLLILNPGDGTLPVYPEYRAVSTDVPFIEMVATAHPVFKGLTLDDLDSWAENRNAAVVNRVIHPFNETMLAAKGCFLQDRIPGAALTEALSGKGRVMISTFLAPQIADRNGAAGKLAANIMEYFASKSAKPAKAPVLVRKVVRSEFSADMSKAKFIDLRPYANRDFKDERSNDGKGGWTDQGDNDFRNMPSGIQTGAGVKFNIIDPAKNNGKGCIILKGKGFSQGLPQEVRGIKVQAKAGTLYFLHTAPYLSGTAEFGCYIIRYADGTTAQIPLIPNWNIADWWNRNPPEAAHTAISAANAKTDKVSFYAFEWHNPVPEKEISTIDFISLNGHPNPILAAITLLPPVPSVDVLKTAKPRWVQGIERGAKTRTAWTRKGKTPVGETFTEIKLPATNGPAFAFAIPRVDISALQGKEPTHFSILFRSKSKGVVDVMLPEKNWKGSLSVPLDLSLSKGEFVRVRFDLKKDFHSVGKKFKLTEFRNEIGLFNGKDRTNGYPRKAAEFDVADFRYEFAQ